MSDNYSPNKTISACMIGVISLAFSACSQHPANITPYRPSNSIEKVLDASSDDTSEGVALRKMGFSVQVGAFANIENAVRLEQTLEKRGIDAYYFRHASGLFKVRFSNHESYQAARNEAERMQDQGLIGNFFIVIPESYAVARIQGVQTAPLREELVRTARGFLGVPYRWGGTDVDNGFDCSGLTMVCYRLNGLNLPRVSRVQYKAGRWVSKEAIREGDLVFFATNGGKRVSHVGMYIGNNRFIHAPRTGKTVRVEKMSNPFFSKTFVGARSYL